MFDFRFGVEGNYLKLNERFCKVEWVDAGLIEIWFWC